jgi:alpha-amylase
MVSTWPVIFSQKQVMMATGTRGRPNLQMRIMIPYTKLRLWFLLVFYLYKFVNGNEWTDKPELPAADCATDDGVGNFNREVTVSSQGINLPVVVFDSCNAILHFSVDMNNEPVSDDGVHVMGDFQEAAGYPSNWSADAIRIEDVNNDGVYSARIPVAPGNYQYRFINGNTPEDAETPPSDCTADDGNGNFNRTITATVGYSQAITYCYNTCDICDPALNTDYATYWWNDAVFLRNIYTQLLRQ